MVSQSHIDADAIGRILVVDDEEAIRTAFQRGLSRVGHEVTIAANASEALAQVAADVFDAVLADIAMPGMNGLELLRALHEHDEELAVLLITGGPSIKTASEAIALRAFRYLTKPLRIDELQRHLRAAVLTTRRARARRARLTHAEHGAISTHTLERAYEHALATLTMAYQPIVTWPEGLTIGYEALVRNEEPSLARPDALFDAAEQLCRVLEIGRAVRSLVAQDLDTLGPGPRLFVNLHPADLLDPALYRPEALLSQRAARVVLEVTERAPLDRMSDLEARIARLRALGFRLAIDDLGAGSAALTSFGALRPDVVKLDIGLVRAIDRKPTQQKVVASLVRLSHELGAQVVSEGVEHIAERDVLLALGTDFFQGFLFGRPAPPFAVARFG